ncbi:hypothetical protein ACLKA6_019258 [Drosophila palustris]
MRPQSCIPCRFRRVVGGPQHMRSVKLFHPRQDNTRTQTHTDRQDFALALSSSIANIQILLFLIATVVLCTPTDRKNDINLTPPKQLTTLLTTTKLTLTLTLPLHLQFLAAFVQLLLLQVQLLLVTTNFQSELHHMLCDLTIQRHTVAITYDLSETPAKKGAPPIPQKRSKSFELCMNSKRRTISHRTSSNRHRKLQPFRYT